MFNGNRPHFTERENGVSLDELLKNALWEGLDYHQEHNRGFPAGRAGAGNQGACDAGHSLGCRAGEVV